MDFNKISEKYEIIFSTINKIFDTKMDAKTQVVWDKQAGYLVNVQTPTGVETIKLSQNLISQKYVEQKIKQKVNK